MIGWYRRDGTKYPKNAYAEIEKDLCDMKKKRVDLTYLWWGGRVSTVWLGLDQRMGFINKKPNYPLIFETMVFPPGVWGELGMDRYSTIREAKKGHRAFVKEWNSFDKGLSGLWYTLQARVKNIKTKIIDLPRWRKSDNRLEQMSAKLFDMMDRRRRK